MINSNECGGDERSRKSARTGLWEFENMNRLRCNRHICEVVHIIFCKALIELDRHWLQSFLSQKDYTIRKFAINSNENVSAPFHCQGSWAFLLFPNAIGPDWRNILLILDKILVRSITCIRIRSSLNTVKTFLTLTISFWSEYTWNDKVCLPQMLPPYRTKGRGCWNRKQ